MSDPVITVTIERKHNLGNYEHVLGSVSVQITANSIEEGVKKAQEAILPFLTVEALTRGVAQQVRAQAQVETNAAPAEPAVAEAPKPVEPEEKPKPVRGRGRAAEEARAAAEAKAAQQAPVTPAAIRARITEICSTNAQAADAVRRHLAANGLARLRRVADEDLEEYLAIAEGRAAVTDDSVI
jgi:hypothetical protein